MNRGQKLEQRCCGRNTQRSSSPVTVIWHVISTLGQSTQECIFARLHLPTPQCPLLEKLTVSQLVNKVPTNYRTQSFTTGYRTADNWTPFKTKRIQCQILISTTFISIWYAHYAFYTICSSFPTTTSYSPPYKDCKMQHNFDPTTRYEIPEGQLRQSSDISITSALDGVGGQRHVQAALPPGKTPGNHCIGGWVDPRDGVDGLGKSRTSRDSISEPDNAIPVHTTKAA
jgi:hypothetical protein